MTSLTLPHEKQGGFYTSGLDSAQKAGKNQVIMKGEEEKVKIQPMFSESNPHFAHIKACWE